MQLAQALRSAIQFLEAARVGSPRLNAETLLTFVLACDRAYLFAHGDRILTPDEQGRYDQALAERARGVPAQYITGHQEFWGMDLVVSPAVLVPRPETEHVVETVLELAQGKTSPRIVDVGTGSACVALALAKELPGAEIHATDISAAALEIARANAARHDLSARIHFVKRDLLAEVAPASFDFVVSNPPYVGECEAQTVQAQVRRFEPKLAVFAGHTGMEIIERLVPQAHSALKPGGWLVMEIGYSSRARVVPLLRDWAESRFVNDLQGIARVATARR